MNTAKGEILASRLGISLYPKRAICQNSSAKEQFIGGKFVVDYFFDARSHTLAKLPQALEPVCR